MSSSPVPAFSRKDSERIYLEILRLEKEREKVKQKEAEEAALKKVQFENDVGRSFFSKIMAKRKARMAAADTAAGDEESNNVESSLLLPPQQQRASSSEEVSSVSVVNEIGPSGGNRRNLEISLQLEPEQFISSRIPCITNRMQAIPPEPVSTPTIVCPNGFKNMKMVNTFTLKFTPAECCGGPRNVEVHAKDQEDKCLCFGRIDSDTEVFLQKQNDEKEMEQLLGFKFDEVTSEWTISFPELETVAYMVKPKAASRVSAAQIYEIFSADGCSNYFNLGVEMEKTGSSRHPDFIFRILNSNLATVGTVILLADWKDASVTIDDSLWPSQKAVILATALYLSWDVIQEIRRKAAWLRVFIAGCIIITILMGILLIHIYILRRDD